MLISMSLNCIACVGLLFGYRGILGHITVAASQYTYSIYKGMFITTIAYVANLAHHLASPLFHILKQLRTATAFTLTLFVP